MADGDQICVGVNAAASKENEMSSIVDDPTGGQRAASPRTTRAASTTREQDPNKPPLKRPYQVHVAWIDGHRQSFVVRFHDEGDQIVTLYINDHIVRELSIPYANLKYFEVDKG
jgi:hypothetical protein